MKTSFGKRLFFGGIGGGLALFFLFFISTVQAQEIEVDENIDPNDCVSCHEEIVGQWEASNHGTEELLYGSLFEGPLTNQMDVATELGGATCDTCHWLGDFSPSHPEMVMHTDMSANLCGTCHQETVLEWENSTHGDEDIACVRCHNPHNTMIKADSVQSLCYRCHTEEAHFYGNTAHAEENLLCTDCHLGKVETHGNTTEGSLLAIKRHHTFDVSLNTCNECHFDDMHMPASDPEHAAIISGTLASNTDSPFTQVLLSNLNLDPVHVNPVSVLLVLLAGVVLGLFVAPQVEQRLRGKDKAGEWLK